MSAKIEEEKKEKLEKIAEENDTSVAELVRGSVDMLLSGGESNKQDFQELFEVDEGGAIPEEQVDKLFKAMGMDYEIVGPLGAPIFRAKLKIFPEEEEEKD